MAIHHSLGSFPQVPLRSAKSWDGSVLSGSLVTGRPEQPEALHTLRCKRLSVFYGAKQVVFDVGFDASKGDVLALIGPSGSGKSTVLRALNRMHEGNPECKVLGSVSVQGLDIYDESSDVVATRMKFGMVFQKPNPYPRSIFENIAYGLRIHGKTSCQVEELFLVEKCLRRVGLWSEVSGRLKQSAMTLSLGQQQRLCIARALAVNPDVILMDEPCSSLDPIATAKIEDLIESLGRQMTIIFVTQCLQQAARVSSRVGLIARGRLIEIGPTTEMFTSPRHVLTEHYLSGRDIRHSEDLYHE